MTSRMPINDLSECQYARRANAPAGVDIELSMGQTPQTEKIGRTPSPPAMAHSPAPLGHNLLAREEDNKIAQLMHEYGDAETKAALEREGKVAPQNKLLDTCRMAGKGSATGNPYAQGVAERAGMADAIPFKPKAQPEIGTSPPVAARSPSDLEIRPLFANQPPPVEADDVDAKDGNKNKPMVIHQKLDVFRLNPNQRTVSQDCIDKTET